jgi:tetratricopeptide (TPR) repeat protein
MRGAVRALRYYGGVMLTRWFPPLVVAIVVLTVAGPADAQDPSFDTAAALQKSGKFEAAAAEYGRFLETHSDNVEARSNLGVVLMQLGRYEEAIAAYRTALSIAPSNATVRLNLGLAFYKSDKLDDAVEAFMRVLAERPDNLQARYLAADCQLRLDHAAAAITLLAPLEATRSDDPMLSYLLGMAYLSTKQTDKGQVLIDRILRHGDSAEAQVMMGMAKRGAGDLKGAAEDLKRAVDLNPDLPGVRALYAQALLEAGNPDLARGEFEAELKRNPLDFDANLYMGLLLKNEQAYDDSLRYFTRALGVRPGDLRTRNQIASVALARRDTTLAIEMLEAIVKEAPSYVEAHVALATAYYRVQRKAEGDRERAIVERLNQEKDARDRVRTPR